MTIEERNNKLKHLITCTKCEVSGKSCDENCPTQYDAGNMGEIIENLEAISKVLEQESRWIPCSEKLPEKSGGYLVTVCYDLLGKGTVREVRKNFFRVLSKKWLYEGDEVTAWMPLPKPYREVEE